MSDIGKNLDINPGFGAGRSSSANSSKKSDVDSKPIVDNSNSQVSIENKSVYKNPSISQAQLGYEAQERLVSQLPIHTKKSNSEKPIPKQDTSDLPKDYELKAKNPVLAAQLKNPKNNLPKNNKQKKSPPEPSLQVQFNPRKGIAINPRKVKPSIPGRLQGLMDDTQNPLDKLAQALDDNYDSNLANIYAKKLINDEAETLVSSLAETFNLDEDLMELTKSKFINQLKDLLQEEALNPSHLVVIQSIIQALESRQDANLLAYIMQFFLPSPFPYVFSELDEEFYEDEEELKREFNENDKDQDEEDNSQEDNEDVEHPDCVCSLSIKTKNYNKIHFYIKQNTKTNCIKVLIKGDSSASEIIIPIESEIEDILFDRVESINYDVSTWQVSVLRITEQKVLKSRLDGKLNPIMLKLCNAILRGINNNDINLYDENCEMF